MNMGHSVSNQPMGVQVASQIWLKFISNIHLLYGYIEHMQNKKFQHQVVSELWPVKVGVVPPFKCARFASLNILRFVMRFRKLVPRVSFTQITQIWPQNKCVQCISSPFLSRGCSIHQFILPIELISIFRPPPDTHD